MTIKVGNPSLVTSRTVRKFTHPAVLNEIENLGFSAPAATSQLTCLGMLLPVQSKHGRVASMTALEWTGFKMSFQCLDRYSRLLAFSADAKLFLAFFCMH